MALLVVAGADRPQIVRIDLGLVHAADGVTAVDGIPVGAHWVSVQRADGWRGGWVHVASPDAVLGLDGEPAPAPSDGVHVLPDDDHGTWTALTSHVRPSASEPLAVVGEELTRFERLVAAHGGAAGVLDELQRSFVEWVLPLEGGDYDEDAGRRWRQAAVAITAAGDRGVNAHPALVAAAARTLAAQLPQLATGIVEPSFEEAVVDLVEDLRPVDPAAAALLRSVV